MSRQSRVWRHAHALARYRREWLAILPGSPIKTLLAWHPPGLSDRHFQWVVSRTCDSWALWFLKQSQLARDNARPDRVWWRKYGSQL